MSLHQRTHPGYGNGPARYPGSFLLAFREAMAELGWETRRWLGHAVECVDAEGREQIVGLENLFRRARREERTEWATMIASVLRLGQEAPLDEPPQNVADVAEKLLVRVGPPMAQRDGMPELWSQAIEGTPLQINLVVDFPQSMFYVTVPMIEASGKPGEVWLEQALENLRQKTPAECFTMLHEESGLRQFSVADAYDSSRVLLLETLLPEFGKHGFLVALPGRDELLVLPITAQGLPFLPLLKIIADKNYKSAPYPISDEVFWIRDARWWLFGVEMRDNQATVNPPEEFLAVMQELTPNLSGEGESPEEK